MARLVALAPAALLLMVATGAAGQPAASSPRTLVSVKGRIGAFAQDGPRIAWLLTTGPCRRRVQLRELTTGKSAVLTARGGATCRAGHRSAAKLALAGRRALWALFAGANHLHLITGAAGGGKDVELERVALPDQAVLAGDGRTLVYTTAGPLFRVVGARARPVPRSYGAYALSADGDRVAALRGAGGLCACNASPTWSPDGRTIAFASGRDQLDEIYAAKLDGGAPVRLTWNPLDEPYSARDPDWSSRGRIAFAEGNVAGPQELFVMHEDGSGASPLPGHPTGTEPAWSPDGLELAFARLGTDWGISIVPAAGDRAVALTNGPDANPDWSPDGAKVAFDRGYETIEIVDRDGTGLRALRPGTHPAWSPDGTKIAYDDGDFLSYVVNADGSGEPRLLGNGTDPAWSPDGTRIALVDSEQVDAPREIFVVNADGSGRAQLTHTVRAPTIVRAEIVELPGARLVGARALAGPWPKSVALSEALLALLYRGQIELRDPSSGALRRSIAVPASATDISIAGRRIVFRTGTSIWLLDGRTRRRSRIAVAAATPVGLSIEGRRVAWVENLGPRARIRAVTTR